MPLQVREAAVALVLSLAAGCGPPEAAELRRARDSAASGIEAAARYCAVRDSLLDLPLATATREALLEEVLRAPEPLDDYCVHLSEEGAGH